MNTKRVRISVLAGLVMTRLAVAAASFSYTCAAELTRPWTTVGSAGTVGELSTTCPLVAAPGLRLLPGNQCSPPADPPKLVFEGATVAFSVIPASSGPVADLILQKEQAVIRYNVVPVEGLFQAGNNIRIKVRFLDIGEDSQLLLKLVEHNLISGTATTRLTFDSNHYTASSSYQEQEVLTSSWSEFDFGQNAYYLEATLTRSHYQHSSADIVGPGVESIQLEKITRFSPRQ